MSEEFTGKNLIHLERVSSTNSYLSELLSNSKPLAEGTVIMADAQTQGRGQMGDYWESEPGKNLCLSVLYYPDFLVPKDNFHLSIAVSLGVLDFLKVYLPKQVKIKWPNDIYVDDKKIGGILIENSLQGNRLKSSIIGMGLNINQTEFSDSLKNPTSLSLLTGNNFELSDLYPTLFSHLERKYLELKSGGMEFLNKDYLDHLYRYKQEVRFNINGIEKTGEITGIENSGRLQVLFDHKTESFDVKEIAFLL